MIFVTVGTIMPFDRLIRGMDEAVGAGVITEPVFAQTGKTDFVPKHIEHSAFIQKSVFDEKVAQSRFIVGHAGIGTIIAAMENNKPSLVMPRMRCYHEHVNDHQVATARKFGDLGHVLVAYEVEELPQKLRELSSFVPTPRVCQPHEVAGRIIQFIDQMSK